MRKKAGKQYTLRFLEVEPKMVWVLIGMADALEYAAAEIKQS